MLYHSTKNKNQTVSLKEAVLKALPQDNGLYMPTEIPRLAPSFFQKLPRLSLREIAYQVAQLYIDDIPANILKKMIEDAINFEAPVKKINAQISVLELFHGPTMAFKDFGARFMARLMNYYNKKENEKLTILVATSGDTGSAVANGFYGLDTIDVVVLYPSEKISRTQESQIATLDKNIYPIEIQGNFDDCQALVKRAFLDKELNQKINLTSANSINIARLIPQSFYYFYGIGQLMKTHPGKRYIVSVPSGNFGNITAGIMGDIMGIPVEKWIASTNNNRVFTDFINTGQFYPKPSVKTLSNAMDVGNPSNFERLNFIFSNNIDRFRQKMESYSYSDEKTQEQIIKVYKKYGYLMDPHGSIGYTGAEESLEKHDANTAALFLETAHPAKFSEVVEPLIDYKITLPPQLEKFQNKPKLSLLLDKKYNTFRDYLLNDYPSGK